jgi:hypothetical protein
LQRSLNQHERRCWWRSARWSAVLHVSIMATLLAQALWLPLPGFEPAAARRVIEVSPTAETPVTLEAEIQIDDRPWIARDAEDLTYTQVDLSDPRWDDLLSEPSRRAEGLSSNEADTLASSLLSEQLMQAIKASAQQSTDDNLQELATLSDRLTEVSSEQSIDELSGTINRLTGTRDRATAPQANIAGEFDHSTAQPHDCRKGQSPDGTVRYLVVMIDAAGRTLEIEVDAATGEQLYKTMQLVKSNPLLERVYRGVVMGILDKLLKTPDPQ